MPARKKKSLKVPIPQAPEVQEEPVDGEIEILESSYTDTPQREPEPRPDYEVLV